MPNRSHLTPGEKASPGPQPMKDRLTLLSRGNASGHLKLKPLHHSGNP